MKLEEELERRLQAIGQAVEVTEPSEMAGLLATVRRRRLRRSLTATVVSGVLVAGVVVPLAVLWSALRGAIPTEGDPPPVFFPTWSSPDRPTANVSGRLIESDGCLFLRSFGKKLLPLWEEGYSYADGMLLDSSGQPVVRVGEVLHGGGGHFSEWQHAEEIVGEPIPQRCRPEGVEPWVLIYDVRAGPPAD